MTRCTTVRDEIDEIVAALRESMNRKVNWILVCGGLGPTYDDVTLEGVSKALGRTSAVDRQALEWLQERYQSLVRQGLMKNPTTELTPARLKMVTLPKGATPIRNPAGSAPGVLIREDSTYIVCMPGVPTEMKAIFEESVSNMIRKMVGPRYTCEVNLELLHVPESSFTPILNRVLSGRPYLYVKSHPLGFADGVFKLRVNMMTTARSKTLAERRIKQAKDELIEQASVLGAQVKEQTKM